MVMHPEVQRKAQAEIDRVVGNDRFPTIADHANLPYVNAVAKEVLRWGPIVPLGKPNALRSCGVAPSFSGTDFKRTDQESHMSLPRTIITWDI